MKKRPNPFWHMMTWGLSSGFILALSFIVVLLDFFDAGFNNWIEIFLSPFIYFLAFVFGGVPGSIMGFFLGLTLWRMLRNVDLPFTKTDMNRKRRVIYGATFSITILLSFFMLSILVGGFLDFLTLIPPFIAATAATYVAHRYMYRLRLWSGGIDNRKSKAKNDAEALSRLTDNVPESIQGDDMIAGTQSLSEK